MPMAKALNQISAPTVLLCAFVIISQVANGLYLSSEIEPPPISFSTDYRAIALRADRNIENSPVGGFFGKVRGLAAEAHC